MSDQPIRRDELLDLLYRAADAPLSAEDRVSLDAALREHAWLREERERLLSMRSALAGLHPDHDPDFVTAVMREVRAERSPLRPLVTRWRAVAAAAVIALAVGGGVIYQSAGGWETEALLGLGEMELDDVYAFDE